MELLFAVIGALIGMVLERMTSFLKSVFFTIRHRGIRGTYKHDDGSVIITTKLGNRFITEGSQTDQANSWTGSFHLDDIYMKTGRGAYHHLHRKDDWGYHYIRLLENGDISVQWENMSAGTRETGALIWRKMP
jgi:hypothetical protein